MKIAISGYNGYIAGNLVQKLNKSGHETIAIERASLHDIKKLTQQLSGISAVINLAGASILRRWTIKNKNEIFRSRIDTTKNIVAAINSLPHGKKPVIFISASAIGIYSSDEIHTEESSSFANDFVGEVVKDWENASISLDPEVRRVIFRIGLILGKEAKTIKNLVPVFKLGFGGKIGTGEQPFPFIHINDVVRAIIWSLESKNVNGIYNLVAPENIDNKRFTRVLADSLKKPAFFTVPAFILKLVLGKSSALLLRSPQIYPERLLNDGFEFVFPDINSCMAEIIQ